MWDLPDGAPDYDRGVAEGGLRDDEQAWFRRRLIELREGTGTGEPSRCLDLQKLVAGHTVLTKAGRWERYANLLPGFSEMLKEGRLSRGDVAAVATKCRVCPDNDWVPLLVAAFIWGWGKKGRGPTHLSWVLDGKRGCPSPGLDQIRHRLAKAVSVLDSKGAGAAYEFLLEGESIPELGPAFFTKFLYFAGESDVPGQQALILDSRLAKRMRWFWARRLDESYAVEGYSAEWLWRGPRWSTYRYRVYLAFLSRVADQLSQPGQRWTPDLVEMLLFRRDPAHELGAV